MFTARVPDLQSGAFTIMLSTDDWQGGIRTHEGILKPIVLQTTCFNHLHTYQYLIFIIKSLNLFLF